MRLSPFHDRTAPLNRMQMWFNWDRYIVPDVYTNAHEELRATRGAVSMGDMSPLSKYSVYGPDANRFLDHVVTRDIAGLAVGRVVYTPWTDERGKVVGDGLICRTADDEFRLTADPQLEWLRQQAAGYEVDIDDITDEYGLLAVQGPRSGELMDALSDAPWAELDFSSTRSASVAGADLLVSRQGFTGELGYEMWVPASAGGAVWDAVAGAGERFGVRSVGEYAIDLARVEAGLLIVGADYTGAGPDRPGSMIDLSPEHQASPFELELGSFVHLGKADFVGKEALLREGENGSRRRLVGLHVATDDVLGLFAAAGVPPLLPNRVWWYPLQIASDARPVGRATSVTWAPTVARIVGFGHLDADVAVLGSEVSLGWELGGVRGDVPARIMDLPFLRHRRAG